MSYDFVKWFRALGGRVPDNFKDVPATTYIYDSVPVSSFKDRAEYIKKKFNHKFRLRSRHDNFLKDEPNIDDIDFVRK